MSRILFITANRLGDAVLSTGVLAHLLEAYPGARVTIVCGPVPAGLFAGVPGLDDIIVLKKKRHSLHWWEMWRRCAFTLWDVVVDLRNAPLSYLLPAKRQMHLGRAGKADVHRVRAMASILGMGDAPPAPKIWTRAQDDARAGELMGTGPVLALGPTANWHGKVWPPERFAEMALRLTDAGGILPGARIAVFAHVSEADMARPVLDALPADRTLDMVGDWPLLTVQACLARTAFYVGNDSGLMHMAAAGGVPTLGLFGPSREEHYAPWGTHTRAVRGTDRYEDVFPPNYDYRNAPNMMGDLTVDMAERAARDLWAEAT